MASPDRRTARLAAARRGVWADGLLTVICALVPLILYRGAADLWWTYDDFFNLRHVGDHSPLDYGFDPAVRAELPTRMLTPLLMLSLDFDLSWAGSDPRGFYLHHLAVLSAVGAAAYLVLRFWLSRGWSALGSALLISGTPFVSLALRLGCRHYLEGLLLGLGAIACMAAAIARRSPRWAVASAALYLLAMLAKEIFVPLGVLLVLLPGGPPRDRLRLAAPLAAALGAYLAFRFAMLGTLAGGYGWAVTAGEVPALLASLPGKTARALAGPAPVWGGAALAGLVVGIAAAVASSRAARLLVGAGAALALLPVLPVSTEMEPRYATASWAVLAVGFAAGCHQLARRGGRAAGWATALAAVTATAVSVSNRATWAQDLRASERMAAEHRFFVGLGVGDALRHPAGPPSAMRELRVLKEERWGLPRGAGWFYDDLFLCLGEPQRVWGWDSEAGRVVEISSRIPALRTAHCTRIRPAALEAEFERRGETLFWRLGPYPAGDWAFVMEEGVEAFAVPRRGGFQIGGLEALALRVRYRSPQGWLAYSPPLEIDFRRSPVFRWTRGTARDEPEAGV